MLGYEYVHAGVGWSESTLGKQKEVQLVDALHPTGTGVIEYEVRHRTPATVGRITIAAVMDPILYLNWSSDVLPLMTIFTGTEAKLAAVACSCLYVDT